ncbi:hypothetical protein [Paenirhodobacter populi]|nr:hypothetical protein [Sinirhodobacter populi]
MIFDPMQRRRVGADAGCHRHRKTRLFEDRTLLDVRFDEGAEVVVFR